MNKKILQILILLFFNAIIFANVTDSNSVIIKKKSGKIPVQYNISDIEIKKSTLAASLNILKVSVDIPEYTMLLLKVTDSTGKELTNLIHDKQVSPGKYIIQWQMGKYSEGRYWCEFETEHFIYRKDFYLK
jgi:hypothetical protein